MRKNIQGINIELTDAIQDYVERKLESVEKMTDPQDESVFADIMLGKTAGRQNLPDLFSAEINLHVSGKFFSACSKADNLYAAIDEVKDEIEQELSHHKDKQETLIRRGGAKVKNILRGLWGR